MKEFVWFVKGISVASVFQALLLVVPYPCAAQVINTGPSAFCHVVDGAFTDCTPGGVIEEWSDISFLMFGGADVYTDQGGGSLHLMYDLKSLTSPLGATQSFDVRFDVQEDGVLEHYLVKCFGDGSMLVFVDGAPHPAEGIQCAVGFSGNVRGELSVPMNVVYSPDIPLFWSASAPTPRPPTDQCPTNLPPSQCELFLQCLQQGVPPQTCCEQAGIPPELCPQATDGDGERTPVSATLTQANSDGTTTVASVPPVGVTLEQLCTIIGNLVDTTVPCADSYKNHGDYVHQVAQATEVAVGSLVNSGVITSEQGVDLQSCVVHPRAKSDCGKAK